MTQEPPDTAAVWPDRIAALVIPADADEPLRLQFFRGQQIRELQKLVRGTVASVPLPTVKATLHFNEEGWTRGMPSNDRAKLLAWAHWRLARGKLEVAGDAVVLGPRIGGRNNDVPAELTRLLTHNGQFQVQAQTRESPMTWVSLGSTRSSWQDAYGMAVSLMHPEADTRNVRVIVAGLD